MVDAGNGFSALRPSALRRDTVGRRGDGATVVHSDWNLRGTPQDVVVRWIDEARFGGIQFDGFPVVTAQLILDRLKVSPVMTGFAIKT